MKKMNAIDENSQNVSNEIQVMLTKSLEEIERHMRNKTDQLKSDKKELNRQLYEILYTQAFYRKQVEYATPLEFLYLSAGFQEMKEKIMQQWPLVTGDLGDNQDLVKMHGEVKISSQIFGDKLQLSKIANRP